MCKDIQSDSYKRIVEAIDIAVSREDQPLSLVFETAHISIPLTSENILWARNSTIFADSVCRYAIKKYGRKIRLINTCLVNDFGTEKITKKQLEDAVLPLYEGNTFLSADTVNIISERNMRNHAAKKLKKLTTEKVGDRVFLTYKNGDSSEFPIANINKNKLIPRCSSIMESFVSYLSSLGKQRLHQQDNPHIIYLSLAQREEEFIQTIYGVSNFRRINKNTKLSAIIALWGCDTENFQLDQSAYEVECYA